MGSNPLVLLNGRATLYIGDVFKWLAAMPDASVDCVVTSPPYWGMRDYGTAFWVEGDPGCDHNLIDQIRAPWANNIKGPNTSGKHGFHETSPTKAVGGRCSRCGAWRTDYQIGLEPTLGQHLDVMVMVFAEIWRVLKPTGSVFLNYGDTYAAEPNGRSAAATKAAGGDDRTFRDKPISTIGAIYEPRHATPRGVFEGAQWGQSGAGTRRVDHGGSVVAGGVLKSKDLCMIPNRLAIALQEWGWWVRSEIVWGKSNPMPDSSGKARPSTAHEKIFLLTKSADADIWHARDTGDLSFHPDLTELAPLATRRDEDGGPVMRPRWIRLGSYYDASAVAIEASPSTHARISQDIDKQAGSTRANGGSRPDRPMKTVVNAALMSKTAAARSGIRDNESFIEALKEGERGKVRGLTPKHEVHINHTGLDDTGRGMGRYLRNYEPAPARAMAPLPVWPVATKPFKDAHFATFPPELAQRAIRCGCPPGGIVLDPFGGAGTTALVALREGRIAHLIELKPEYAEMTRQRLELDWMGPEERARRLAKVKAEKNPPNPLPLFKVAAE